MRLRLSLTLDIKREPKDDEEPHETFESQGSLVERSEATSLGFVIPGTEREERR